MTWNERSERWSMISSVEPLAGWSRGSRTVTRTGETTSIMDPTGKGECQVEVDGVGVDPRTPIGSSAESVVVQGKPGLFQESADGGAVVFWPYRDNAWASVSCRLGPTAEGGEPTPATVREATFQVAERVSFGTYAMEVPIRIAGLPSTHRVKSLQLDDSRFAGWSITLEPTQPGTAAPVIKIGPSGGSVPEATMSVGDYPASFFTMRINGPVNRSPKTYVSYATLCLLTTPVPLRITAMNTATDDPDSRRELFRTIAEQTTYAASPTDRSTWFNATDALPF